MAGMETSEPIPSQTKPYEQRAAAAAGSVYRELDHGPFLGAAPEPFDLGRFLTLAMRDRKGDE